MSTSTDHESTLLKQIADLKAELTRARELAAWFRDEHTRTLPVVASFRRWRMGHQDAAAFHEHLRGDTCGKALSLEPVVPMQAMADLLDSRKGPDDGCRATELRWLNRQEEELLKRQRAEMAEDRRRLRGGS